MLAPPIGATLIPTAAWPGVKPNTPTAMAVIPAQMYSDRLPGGAGQVKAKARIAHSTMSMTNPETRRPIDAAEPMPLSGRPKRCPG